MANKIKNHSSEVMNFIKTLSSTLYAHFLESKMSVSKVMKETGLSANSIKTIFKGDTANIASYIAVAKCLGLQFNLEPASQTREDGSPASKFLQKSAECEANKAS